MDRGTGASLTPGYGPAPEMWLDPGPPLPRRTWQRRTRVPVIVATAVALIVFAVIVGVAVVAGLLTTPTFTAKGGVVADCATERATLPGGGTLARGAPVILYDAAGGEVARTTLSVFLRGDDGCQLTFEVSGVDYTDAGYLVSVGDADRRFSESVSTAALQQGAVLRPLG
ncbi:MULTISPECIES: hypothetical protein [unclassified Gordonia (in: high G+C Gram-positive bacteria)]|uniref:hypothetical protein n=1 Tax=unclassified Gordonia (in: high G+C Gram-positive bacteria) TaxID=2657482 RepID=UPI00071DE250|nr:MULTISPECIES: hypothetical protein [unclassified Gordonia (in: high G+C Gram-positive bacteria)]KSU58169.1 hypothetical protein AS181_11695 [Gordonia sp. SGD-V-85]SCC26376.1 hypothetical protein GA0061091_10897 [Gordonia sp. v-85]